MRPLLYHSIEHMFQKGVKSMRYTTSHLEDSIERLYQAMEIEDPDYSIFDVAERLSITISYFKLPFAVPGHIALSPALKEEKQKEVFAHELNHVLFHVGLQIYMPEDFRIMQEYKACSFAMHFAIPTFMLRRLILPDDRYKAITMISETFGVTPSFANKRLIRYENQIAGAMLHEKLLKCSESKPVYEYEPLIRILR